MRSVCWEPFDCRDLRIREIGSGFAFSDSVPLKSTQWESDKAVTEKQENRSYRTKLEVHFAWLKDIMQSCMQAVRVKLLKRLIPLSLQQQDIDFA